MTPLDIQSGPLAQRIARFAPQCVATSLGEIEFRRAGKADSITHVLLHGIGSGSASWLHQLEAAEHSAHLNVVAWEAPGYGRSTAVTPEHPDAGDYARRLWSWLDGLQLTQPVTLVGHSLGALMVARAALLRPEQVKRLVLMSPAQGYARASAEDRQKKLHERLTSLHTLGLQGMADKRGAAMLAPGADPERVRYVQGIMAQLNPPGYIQAIHLLVGGDLLTDVAAVRCPVSVASGDADTITPLAGCQKVAASAGVPWVSLGAAGHACAIDAFEKVNTLLGLTTAPEQASETNT